MSGATFTKVISVVGLLCGAVYFVAVQKDTGQAMTLFFAALAAAGFTATAVKIRADQKAMKADLEDIRNNPNMPGTPPAP